MIRMMTVVGARPQFVKAAVVSRLIETGKIGPFEEIIVHTGQHYDTNMSQVFFEELGIAAPRYHLGVGSGSHGAQTGAIMSGLEIVVAQERPDILLVYGDTNSTLAAALVAAKTPVPLAHVEAGLRSHRLGMPEEVNRVVTDRLSDLLFCPTRKALENLAREGRTDALLVGDVMYDGFRLEAGKADKAIHRQYGLSSKAYVLATVHRAENTDDPARLAQIMAGLARSPLPVLLTLHPRTCAALERDGLKIHETIKVIPPQPYRAMVSLLLQAAIVATDSGGLQKEATFARVPCITFREETEWMETVETGWNRLTPIDAEGIAGCFQSAMAVPSNPPPYFGDGDAGTHILNAISERMAKE